MTGRIEFQVGTEVFATIEITAADSAADITDKMLAAIPRGHPVYEAIVKDMTVELTADDS